MAGFTVERGPFTSATKLVASLIDDMVAHGFTLVSPGTFNSSTATAPYKVTLEASSTVDPLQADQPWRMVLDVQQEQTAFCYVGTPLTMPNDGSITYFREVVQSSSVKELRPTDVLGNVNYKMGTDEVNTSDPKDAAINKTTLVWTPPTSGSGQPVVDHPEFGFINRRYRIPTIADGALAPMRYRLSITDRGIWFGIFEEGISASDGYNFNWVLVQRPVDRLTGETIVDGKAPVWAVAYNAPNLDFPTTSYMFQHVVREKDVLRPYSGDLDAPQSLRRRADINQDDSDAIINNVNQVSLSEDGKYIVTFPARLNTARYCYSYELDMIGITSADVVSQDTEVPLTVYGESSPRQYLAMHATSTNNTGMRILVLTQGGGIS